MSTVVCMFCDRTRKLDKAGPAGRCVCGHDAWMAELTRMQFTSAMGRLRRVLKRLSK